MISVIIATYNGQNVLPKTLEALSQLEQTNQGAEFIVVDNASTDSSAEILAEYSDKLPLKILYEPRQGKSYAIHTGLLHAIGDLIVFSDDDVIPERNWLCAYEQASSNQKDYSVFLGQIRPLWPAKPPRWFVQLADEGLACGCTSKSLTEGGALANWVKGANFCVRKRVLDKVSFRNDLWVAGGSCIGGEDTDFVKKAVTCGFKLWFVPNASLQHIIRLNEMTMKGVWKRYFRIGRSMVALDRSTSSQKQLIWGYPRWFVFKILKQFTAMMLGTVKCNQYETVSKMIVIAISCGQEYENKHGL